MLLTLVEVGALPLRRQGVRHGGGAHSNDFTGLSSGCKRGGQGKSRTQLGCKPATLRTACKRRTSRPEPGGNLE